ncbi:MAG: hypothetical protein IIB61_05625 [Planctomycetes bacterium]|nr:hypothetical protein [Planctomycetota bacterium]
MLSLVIMLLPIWGAVKLSAKLFRVGTLTYGKRVGLREILKAHRQPTQRGPRKTAIGASAPVTD